MKISIIGFGRLGRLLGRNLSFDFDVSIYDKQQISSKIFKENHVKEASLEEVAKSSIIILSVPIGHMEDALKKLAPHLKNCSKTLIVDVCSVKEKPIQLMKEILPSKVSILGTHPMFGPDSAKNSLFGNQVALCKVRVEDKLYDNIKNYLLKHGLKVTEISPEEHDRQISHSLVLTHFIGRALMKTNESRVEIDTLGYRRLLKILETVEHDSWELFEDMNKYNRFAKEMREEFLSALEEIGQKVEE